MDHSLVLDKIKEDHRELLKDKTIADLNKQAEKQKRMDFSLDGVLQNSEYLFNAYETGAENMQILGIDTVKLRDVELDVTHLRDHKLVAAKQQVLSLQKAASYQKKKSDQEKAAIARGEYSDYKTDKAEAATLALQKYEEDKTAKSLDGKEFLERPEGDSMEQISERVANVIRAADWLKNKVKDMKSKNPKGIDAVQLKVEEDRLEVVNDAIKTFYAANGVSMTGKKVSAKDIEKAKLHLPLALEKYNFYINQKNYDYLVGKGQEEFIKKSAYGKNYMKKYENDNKKEGELGGLDQGEKQAIVEIQKLIHDKPEIYAQHKESIDKVYGELLQTYKAIGERMITGQMVAGYIYDEIKGGAQARLPYQQFRQAVSDSYGDQEFDLLNIKVEGDLAYLKYLLTGKEPNAVLAPYLKEKYNVDGISRQDKTTRYTETKQLFDERIAELERPKEGLSPEEAIEREKAAKKLKTDPTILKSVASMEQAMVEYSDSGIKLRAIQASAKSGLDGAALSKKRYLMETGRGYRDIARTLTPLGQESTVTKEQVDAHAKILFVSVKTGVRTLKEDEAIKAKDLHNAFTGYITDLSAGIADLHNYMTEHPGFLGGLKFEDVMKDTSALCAFYKKAQGLRDALELLSSKVVADTLSDDELKNLAELRAEAVCLTKASELTWGAISDAQASGMGTAISNVDVHNSNIEVQRQRTHSVDGENVSLAEKYKRELISKRSNAAGGSK